MKFLLEKVMNRKELQVAIKSVEKDLALSRSDLNNQMIKQAGLYLHYAMACSRAMRDEKRAKLQLEMLETELYRELSEHHSRVTEKMVTSQCHVTKSWIRTKQLLDEMSYAVDVLKGVCLALVHKKDMLVNLGATIRTEMAGEVSTKS